MEINELMYVLLKINVKYEKRIWLCDMCIYDFAKALDTAFMRGKYLAYEQKYTYSLLLGDKLFQGWSSFVNYNTI